MTQYIFGLSNPITKNWIIKEWKNSKSRNINEFIEKKLLKSNNHILPLFPVDEENRLIRKRYFENLSEFLTKSEMKEILQLELKTILPNLDNGKNMKNDS